MQCFSVGITALRYIPAGLLQEHEQQRNTDHEIITSLPQSGQYCPAFKGVIFSCRHPDFLNKNLIKASINKSWSSNGH